MFPQKPQLNIESMSANVERQQRITFDQLNSMIDNWNLVSMDMQRKYHDQKDVLNELFVGLAVQEDPLRKIHTQLNTIIYYYALLQLELGNIADRNVQLEIAVDGMENIQKNMQVPCASAIRETMYKEAGSIFSFLSNMTENLDVLLQDDMRTHVRGDMKQITNLWIENLNDLEKIEQMIYKLESAVQVIDCRKRLYISKLKH